MIHIYHLLPKTLVGDVLFPLNDLKTRLPAVFDRQMRKYAGREALLTRRIPILECLWNDVLFFAAVSPAALRDGFLSTGLDWQPRRWLVVDTDSPAFDRSRAVIYTPATTPATTPANKPATDRAVGDFDVAPEQFTPFAPDHLSDQLPPQTLAYYRRAAANGDPIFAWWGVPHVLYHGTVDTSQGVIIQV